MSPPRFTVSPESVGVAARAIASGPRLSPSDPDRFPWEPGVYCFWAATAEARRLLGLSITGAEQPLYIGHARRALRRRVGEYTKAVTTTHVPIRADVEIMLLSAGHMAVPEWTLFPEVAFTGANVRALPFARAVGPSVSAWMERNLAVSVVTAGSADEANALEMALIDCLAPTWNISGMKRHFAIPTFGADRFRPDATIRADDWQTVTDVCAALAEVPEAQREKEFAIEFDEADQVVVRPTGRHWERGDPLAMAAVPSDRTLERSARALGIWFGGLAREDEELIEPIVELIGVMGEEHCWMPAFTMAWMSDRQWHYERSLRPLE